MEDEKKKETIEIIEMFRKALNETNKENKPNFEPLILAAMMLQNKQDKKESDLDKILKHLVYMQEKYYKDIIRVLDAHFDLEDKRKLRKDEKRLRKQERDDRFVSLLIDTILPLLTKIFESFWSDPIYPDIDNIDIDNMDKEDTNEE